MTNINAAVFAESIVNHCTKNGAKVSQFVIIDLPRSLQAVVLAKREFEYVVWNAYFHPQDTDNQCRGLFDGFYTDHNTEALEEFIDRVSRASKRAYSKE